MDFADVKEHIEKNKEAMLSDLSFLISIPSVAVRQEGEHPFGDHVARAYEALMAMAEREGFKTFDADGFGGHIDFPGSGSGIVGVVGHLDVVPEGENWDFDPYGGRIEDGFVKGRGTVDDKGPVVASFYAMKALRDCGFVPGKTVRLILGLDEETEWEGMDHYLSKVDSLPDLGFTPDGDFPAIHGEMGILVFDLAKKFSGSGGKGLSLSSLKGGNAANSVADSARAVVYDSSGAGYEAVRERVALFRKEKKRKISCRAMGKSLEITTEGISAHGAKPWQGENAVSLMMEFLGGLRFTDDDVNDFIEFYNDHIGYDIHGERIGCDISDEQSGRLVFNVGMAEADKSSGRITVNVRYPVTAEMEDVYAGIMKISDKYSIGLVKGKHQGPIYVPSDDPFIETLMDVYREHTGDRESSPLVIGGGTYARAIKNIVAFGARFPGEPELGHQKNEQISVENMMLLTEIYADAIYRLSEAGGKTEG